MIDHIQLLRNVGQFDSVTAGSNYAFSKLTLIYAGNGRGKTTLAAIFRSLGTGDAKLVTERRRLSASHEPHIVIDAGTSYVFQNGSWSSTYGQFAVFDDAFVAENVCSGMEIGVEHRQKLHELILGAQGVNLNKSVQQHVDQVEQHNKTLKEKGAAIPAVELGTLTVDAFCTLKSRPGIDALILEAERSLAAARASEEIAQAEVFQAIALPTFPEETLPSLLRQTMESLDSAAADRVQAHFRELGATGELWIDQGMKLIGPLTEDGRSSCPFCAQDLDRSPLFGAYRSYFSDGYTRLKSAVNEEISSLQIKHGGEAPAAFERAVRIASQKREFWKDFVEVPEITIDTAEVARVWKRAYEATRRALLSKQSAPLELIELSTDQLQAVANYKATAAAVTGISNQLVAINAAIALAKEQAAVANLNTLASDLMKLKAVKARFSSSTDQLCQVYLDEKAAKKVTEGLRDDAREQLDTYRTNVFPAYEVVINTYLSKFNAGFRLASVTSVNNRSGSSCSYSVLIDSVAVALSADEGKPCFKNTLSAGDRNTLALAFFFASIEKDPSFAQMVVIIDDPMTSLDEHRSLTTVQEMRRLANRTKQLIVLSHSKPFLCAIWQGADSARRSALKLVRGNKGSVIEGWDVNADSITEHDKRHAAVSSYINGAQGADEREVAEALRPILECYVRVAYPANFPPGSLLGPFINTCTQRKGTPGEILGDTSIVELRDLLDYGNKFHHDTNAAWETETINDQELLNFCERTLCFTRRT